jgi:hypothetical protein
VNFSVLGRETCATDLRGQAFQRFPDPGADAAVEDCKLLELMDRYTPGAGVVESRDDALIRTSPSEFDVLFFNYPGDGERTWSEAYEPEWLRTPEERRAGFVHAYVHPFIERVESGGFELILQYWFFYPTNDSGMDHEGDWEHINVVVSPRSMVEGGLSESVVSGILDGRITTDERGVGHPRWAHHDGRVRRGSTRHQARGLLLPRVRVALGLLQPERLPAPRGMAGRDRESPTGPLPAG